ncbi:MAG: fumarylacetoacetate hydrolase family protein [Pirellulales bacterium]
MRLGRVQTQQGPRACVVHDTEVEVLDLSLVGLQHLDELLSHPSMNSLLPKCMGHGKRIAIDKVQWLPPIDRQEVWAAGVTYKRSQTARMEESEAAADCYSRVYNSPRPEIFFKGTPSRCSGNDGEIRIRYDATWNVPEPELALVISKQMTIVGYTIGNDMSSRDIEGENPLYLPQAKVYRQCCGLGPWITLAEYMPPREQIGISLQIERHGQVVFEGQTSVAQMARKLEELVQWLGREDDFPHGVFLLTGTGIVPDSTFTLAAGDVVTIQIDGIGRLRNTIVQSPPRS